MLEKFFDTWKRLDFERQKMRMLWGFMGVLSLIIFGLLINLHTIASQLTHQRLYITPAKVLRGGYYRANTLSNSFVYGFSYQMFVAINTWSEGAAKDYQKNIRDYRYYMTPRYRAALTADYQQSISNGNLLASVQTLAPYNGMGVVSGMSVQAVDDNSWIVTLPLRVTRFKDNAVLMDALYEYKIRVRRTTQSIQYNPWGLALDALIAKKRLKTFL